MIGSARLAPSHLAGRLFIAVSLLLLWVQVGGLYTATLLPPVNYVFQTSDIPVTLARDGQDIVLGLQQLDGLWRAFQLKGQDLV